MRPTVRFQIIALVPIILFVVMRAFIYHFFPIHSYEDWIQSDLIKNIPRVLCTVVAYLISKKYLAKDDWNIFRSRGWKIASMYLLVSLSFSWIDGFWNPPQSILTTQILVIGLGSLCAAIFEEFAFRFLLLKALLTSLTERRALVVSSFTFMLYHVQAQPPYTWPYLFAAGIQMAALRLMGVSLIWLILDHAVYDTIIFYLDSPNINFGYFIFTVLNLILAGIFWRQRENRRIFVKC